MFVIFKKQTYQLLIAVKLGFCMVGVTRAAISVTVGRL